MHAMLCYAIVLSIYCNVLYHNNCTKSIINWNPQSNVVCTAINENAENWCANHRTFWKSNWIFARPKKAHNDQNNTNKGVMCVTQYSLPDNITSAHSILSVQIFWQLISLGRIWVSHTLISQWYEHHVH